MKKKTVIVVGAGPAGLTAAYELLDKSKDFDVVYEYLIRRLHEANIKKDAEIMEEVLKHLRTMRDTWKEVMRLAKTGQAGS